jgi:hypothetical protein
MLSLFAAATLALSVGCASSDAAPPTEPEVADKQAAPSKKGEDDNGDTGAAKKGEDEAAAPAFEAEFDPAAPKPAEPEKPGAEPKPAPVCVDNDDAGGTENLAKKLPDTDDCNGDMLSLKGTLKSAVDVDMYKLAATDKGRNGFGWCNLDTVFQNETANAEMCVFMKCKDTTKDAVSGCAKGTEKTNDLGMKGCCVSGAGQALPTWDCDGGIDNDSADIFIRMRQLNGDRCLPYTAKYRF